MLSLIILILIKWILLNQNAMYKEVNLVAIPHRTRTITPGRELHAMPRLCELCVGSFTSHRVMNIEGL